METHCELGGTGGRPRFDTFKIEGDTTRIRQTYGMTVTVHYHYFTLRVTIRGSYYSAIVDILYPTTWTPEHQNKNRPEQTYIIFDQ